MKIVLSQIVENTQGKVEGRVESVEISGASIDSRTIRNNELFFALRGEKADGHNYLAQAREKGAAGAVVEYIPADFQMLDFPLILVKDGIKALQQSAAYVRSLFSGPVIAVTGSTGKTTIKDMLAALLSVRGSVLSTGGNYNNELGLPLTLLSMKEEHWAAVLEMGMRGLGEIDFLARLSQPSFGVISNIGHTHQEILGSQQKIAQAKAELISHIPVDGGMVLNIEDKELLQPWLANVRSRLSWVGLNMKAQIRADEISTIEGKGIQFSIYLENKKKTTICLPFWGRHNVNNALAAAAVGYQLGMNWDEIKCGLEKTKLTPMRLEFLSIPGKNIQLINDTYNANPSSVQAALEVLEDCAKVRAIAVLGDMYELGDYTEEGHRLVGKKVKEINADYLITVGRIAQLIAEGAKMAGFDQEKIRTCQTNEEALSYLKEIITNGDVILLKGSRGVRMESITKELLSDKGA